MDTVFEFMIEKNLLSSTQSGVKPNDSWVNQLIAIIHNIFSKFNVYPSIEVLVVLLDLSKAFDRVWDKGLLYKSKNQGITSERLGLIESFLHSRHKRAALNVLSANWKFVKAGVSQVSAEGPLCFLMYISDLLQGLIFCWLWTCYLRPTVQPIIFK